MVDEPTWSIHRVDAVQPREGRDSDTRSSMDGPEDVVALKSSRPGRPHDVGGPWRTQIHSDRKQVAGVRGWGRGEESGFNGDRAPCSHWGDEKVLEVMVVMVTQHGERPWCP